MPDEIASAFFGKRLGKIDQRLDLMPRRDALHLAGQAPVLGLGQKQHVADHARNALVFSRFEARISR